MKLLIVGGTGFIGKHFVNNCTNNNHEIHLVSRGSKKQHLPSGVEHYTINTQNERDVFKQLSKTDWDVCVDLCGYTAPQVETRARLLRNNTKHYIYVSAVSVYQKPDKGPLSENALCLEPAPESENQINQMTYGRLKVTCENIVKDLYIKNHTILRPQVIVGPYDQTGRFTYWLNSAKHPDSFFGPGSGKEHLQVIDVRDVANFMLHAAEEGIFGTYNLAGQRITWKDFVALLGHQNPRWLPQKYIAAAGLGFRELPLFRDPESHTAHLMNISSEKAKAAGLKISSLADTIRDTRAWMNSHPLDEIIPIEIQQELLKAEDAQKLLQSIEHENKQNKN